MCRLTEGKRTKAYEGIAGTEFKIRWPNGSWLFEVSGLLPSSCSRSLSVNFGVCAPAKLRRDLPAFLHVAEKAFPPTHTHTHTPPNTLNQLVYFSVSYED
ncbi:hypothetical protein, unlikely [Trypanosoma brucei gambiense DAL972]|uniref:Uncharacterized protein n=1 Tax=Trypanosoma brucei gambiense (strain MHOM/CI/86/DAL972) TaxID=679716 RepID=C9ZNS4_TRYB9|nr:hypothetical protein, unlikely [Trypanosoma brucei gambiense DAL972]CBH11052.1 hypothetical protein, unlikely [Trypanosoma brucei gambiense DAL972]|eukprot:XP_011773339.1 hypothetical protein, unlikely [Trypanosoma brucei gambiense DAL972]